MPSPVSKTRSEHRLADDPFVKQERARFAAAVANWRERLDLSRKEVAERIGISIQQVQAIEKDRSSPSQAVLILLRKEMGLPSLSSTGATHIH